MIVFAGKQMGKGRLRSQSPFPRGLVNPYQRQLRVPAALSSTLSCETWLSQHQRSKSMHRLPVGQPVGEVSCNPPLWPYEKEEAYCCLLLILPVSFQSSNSAQDSKRLILLNVEFHWRHELIRSSEKMRKWHP